MSIKNNTQAYYIVFLVIVVSFFLGSYALESIGIQYVSEGGSSALKIHMYSYLVLVFFTYYFLSKGLRGIKADLNVFYSAWISFVISIVFVIIFGLLKFGTSGMAYVVDTLLVPALLLPIVFSLSISASWKILKLIFLVLIINICAAVYEYVNSMQIFSYEYEEHWVYFRSTAFFSHPLSNALICSFLAMFLIRPSFINPLILFVCTALSLFCFGARTATGIFIFFALIELYFLYNTEYKKTHGFRLTELLLLKITIGLGLAVILYSVFVLGFGQRIFENLAFDGSARSRYDVFLVFQYLSFDEYLFGASSDFFENIIFYIDNAVIENYVIGWFLLYGLVGSAFLIVSFYYLFYCFYVYGCRSQRIATVVFLLISISNNSLSTKNPALLFFFVAYAASIKTINLKSKNIRVL